MFNDYQLAGEDHISQIRWRTFWIATYIYSRLAGCSPIQFSRISVARQRMVSGVNGYIGRRN